MSLFFFFNDTATPEIYTLSLHDALPICVDMREERDRRRFVIDGRSQGRRDVAVLVDRGVREAGDRKSTRLNSSHEWISYAVFCLKKKKKKKKEAQEKQKQQQIEYANTRT